MSENLTYAREKASSGQDSCMEAGLGRAKEAAAKTRMPMPYTNDIEIEGYTKAVSRCLDETRDNASRGEDFSMENWLGWAKEAAVKACMPMPDTSDIKIEGYTKAVFRCLDKARYSASRGAE